MKKILLLSLLCVMHYANINAAAQKSGAWAKVAEAAKVAKDGAKTALRSGAKGLANSLGNVSISTANALSIPFRPIQTVKHPINTAYSVTQPLLKTALKPFTQGYRAVRNTSLLKPSRAAEREVRKLENSKLERNVAREKKYEENFDAYKQTVKNRKSYKSLNEKGLENRYNELQSMNDSSLIDVKIAPLTGPNKTRSPRSIFDGLFSVKSEKNREILPDYYTKQQKALEKLSPTEKGNLRAEQKEAAESVMKKATTSQKLFGRKKLKNDMKWEIQKKTNQFLGKINQNKTK